MVDVDPCPNCGRALAQAGLKDGAEMPPTMADVLAELRAIRALLEHLSSGGNALRVEVL